MNNTDKRKIKLDWKIAGDRIFMLRGTYFQALLYINNLRLQGVKDLYYKPILNERG